MPTYKLYYFDGRGRAEVPRYLFALGNIDYEDIRLTQEKWKNSKSMSPFGQLPMLEVDGQKLCQSNTIARFIAERTGHAGKSDLEKARANMIVDCAEDMVKPFITIFFCTDEALKAELQKKWDEEQKDQFLHYFEKFLEENKCGYLVGDSLTWADLTLVNALSWMPDLDLTEYKLIKALIDRVNNEPAIAAWIEKRPKTLH